MFSGQGSQYFQMGAALYQANAVFRAEMTRLDAVVRQLSGRSVLEALYEPGRALSSPFDQTSVSHPAIVMVEYALAQALVHAGVKPDIVLGASLGSFTAAALAGALRIEDALAAALAHARALEQRCPPGGMVAVLESAELYKEDFIRNNAELAAVNFESHFVISAPSAQCAAIEAELGRRDIPCQRIAVSFAFHSRWIEDARSDFEAALRALPIRPLQLPFVCCDRAAVLTQLHAGYFWDVTRHPIRFPEAIAQLERDGACRYLDLGPAGTLATFLKYLLPRSTCSTAQAILTPYGQDLRNWTQATAPGP